MNTSVLPHTRLAVLVASALLALPSVFAEPGTEIHSDFEKINAVVKGTDKYYMHHIQDGWQFTKGPVAFVPAGWSPNCGAKGIFMSIDCSEDDTMKPYVHSGIGSLKAGVVDGKGGVHILYAGNSLKPGKYKLSVWTKGTGKVSFCTYSYFGPGDRRIETRACGCETKPSADWVKTEKIISCGADVKGAKSSTFAFSVSGGDVYIDDLDVVPAGE